MAKEVSACGRLRCRQRPWPLQKQEQIKALKNAPIARFDGLGCYQTRSKIGGRLQVAGRLPEPVCGRFLNPARRLQLKHSLIASWPPSPGFKGLAACSLWRVFAWMASRLAECLHEQQACENAGGHCIQDIEALLATVGCAVTQGAGSRVRFDFTFAPDTLGQARNLAFLCHRPQRPHRIRCPR